MADSLNNRSRSKKVELLAGVYDHVEHVYRKGFRLQRLGGTTFLSAVFSLLSSEKASSRLQSVDTRVGKRTVHIRKKGFCAD